MKESVTYQAILEERKAEGKAEGRRTEAQNLILRIGKRRFGEPRERVEAALLSIESVERLEQ